MSSATNLDRVREEADANQQSVSEVAAESIAKALTSSVTSEAPDVSAASSTPSEVEQVSPSDLNSADKVAAAARAFVARRRSVSADTSSTVPAFSRPDTPSRIDENSPPPPASSSASASPVITASSSSPVNTSPATKPDVNQSRDSSPSRVKRSNTMTEAERIEQLRREAAETGLSDDDEEEDENAHNEDDDADEFDDDEDEDEEDLREALNPLAALSKVTGRKISMDSISRQLHLDKVAQSVEFVTDKVTEQINVDKMKEFGRTMHLDKVVEFGKAAGNLAQNIGISAVKKLDVLNVTGLHSNHASPAASSESEQAQFETESSAQQSEDVSADSVAIDVDSASSLSASSTALAPSSSSGFRTSPNSAFSTVTKSNSRSSTPSTAASVELSEVHKHENTPEEVVAIKEMTPEQQAALQQLDDQLAAHELTQEEYEVAHLMIVEQLSPEDAAAVIYSRLMEAKAARKAAKQAAREQARKAKLEAAQEKDSLIPVGLLKPFKPLVEKVQPLLQENLAMIRYDPSRNNALGATVDCLDRRLFCSCIVHDEVRLGTWLLFISALACFLLFTLLDAFLNGVRGDTIRNHPHFLALMISLPFCVVSTLLCMVQISNHRKYWTHVASQRQIVRILLMVPIYAWAAWFSLLYLPFSVYIDFVRVCYEAYVIWSFLLLLTKYLGGRNGVLAILKQYEHTGLAWPSPFCCFPRVKATARFMYWIKYGVLQYVFITPPLAFVAAGLNWIGHYGDGEIDWTKGFPYVALIQNFSQLVSLYCLVWFYMVSAKELTPFKPVAKFLVVKSVVFFTFWQSIALAFAVHWGWVHDVHEFSVGEVQIAIQDFCIVIEMFIAAVFHRHTFGHEPYMPVGEPPNQIVPIKSIMDLRAAAYKGESKKPKKGTKKRSAKGDGASSPSADTSVLDVSRIGSAASVGDHDASDLSIVVHNDQDDQSSVTLSLTPVAMLKPQDLASPTFAPVASAAHAVASAAASSLSSSNQNSSSSSVGVRPGYDAVVSDDRDDDSDPEDQEIAHEIEEVAEGDFSTELQGKLVKLRRSSAAHLIDHDGLDAGDDPEADNDRLVLMDDDEADADTIVSAAVKHRQVVSKPLGKEDLEIPAVVDFAEIADDIQYTLNENGKNESPKKKPVVEPQPVVEDEDEEENNEELSSSLLTQALHSRNRSVYSSNSSNIMGNTPRANRNLDFQLSMTPANVAEKARETMQRVKDNMRSSARRASHSNSVENSNTSSSMDLLNLSPISFNASIDSSILSPLPSSSSSLPAPSFISPSTMRTPQALLPSRTPSSPMSAAALAGFRRNVNNAASSGSISSTVASQSDATSTQAESFDIL